MGTQSSVSGQSEDVGTAGIASGRLLEGCAGILNSITMTRTSNDARIQMHYRYTNMYYYAHLVLGVSAVAN